MDDREYLVALYAYRPFGPARARVLIDYFGSAKEVWRTDKKELKRIGLKDSIVSGFISHKKNFSFKAYFSKLKKLSINFTTFLDDSFPSNLADLEDGPCVLYYRGTLKKSDVNSVAIVGTRKMTSYGREMAAKFAGELAHMGIAIVSGLALGVDAQAHVATLEAGGRALAVIASGLDIITPRSNYNLAVQIVKRGGAIISESPLGTMPFKASFPVRNRIISGLAKAVVVIEGELKSGTLLTASAAAKQGRTVFAVPGQITSPMSGAPNYLIQNGAKPALSVKDIVEELDLQFMVDQELVEKVLPADDEENSLLELMENEPRHLDEIVRLSAFDMSMVSAKLTMMELKGLVKSLGDGMYRKR